MKKKSIGKNLVLNKETISSLDSQDLKEVNGGASYSCLMPYTKCICEW